MHGMTVGVQITAPPDFHAPPGVTLRTSATGEREFPEYFARARVAKQPFTFLNPSRAWVLPWSAASLAVLSGHRLTGLAGGTCGQAPMQLAPAIQKQGGQLARRAGSGLGPAAHVNQALGQDR